MPCTPVQLCKCVSEIRPISAALLTAGRLLAGRLLQVSPYLLLNADGQQYPIVYFDEFWLLRDKLLPVNESLDSAPLHITVKTQKFWWMQIQQQVTAEQENEDRVAGLHAEWGCVTLASACMQ